METTKRCKFPYDYWNIRRNLRNRLRKKVEKYTFYSILYLKHKRTDTCYMQASVLYTKLPFFLLYKINISPLNLL
ncbi:hypothetical protein BCSAG_27390 [Bacillus cereus]|uniref:Uncharacterized protein n=1 Tax=Bacillus thuringiensis DB27 TaxID=1431339 RepID=W8Y633_BACTU|nr:unnamed protein product [Bacillus thuringiensis DB27]